MEGLKLDEPKPWEPNDYDSNISDNEEEQEEEEDTEEDRQSDISLSESDISEREIKIKITKKIKPHSLKNNTDYKEILEEDLFFFPEDIIYG